MPLPKLSRIGLIKNTPTVKHRKALLNEQAFVDAVNIDIDQLNVLIQDYNASKSMDEKTQLLQKIIHEQQEIDNKYPPDIMGNCASYREAIYIKFYKELILNRHLLALKNNQEEHVDTDLTSAQLLVNMSPEKSSQLLGILLKGAQFNRQDYVKLYNGENNPEALAFKTFLGNHTLTFLGGSNSKNFKITPKVGLAMVLKIDNRLNMPKSAEAHLKKHSLQQVLTRVYTERQATFIDEVGSVLTRTLLITEFCDKGNLETHSTTCPDNPTRIKSALQLYKQMGTILEHIRDDDCAFPDMKNTNWLVDQDGKLRISDTKSFVFSKNDVFDLKCHSNRWYKFLRTDYMNPPELSTPPPFSVDKLHAYLFGKNLYQYLTRCNHNYLNHRNDEQQYDFSAAVFKSEQGRLLKELLKKMIKINPEHRISVREASSMLTHIEQYPQIKAAQDQCRAVLSKFVGQEFGKKDIVFLNYIQTKEAEIAAETDLVKLNAIRLELAKVYKNISGVETRAIHDIIDSFRRRSHFFTVGMKAKARRIEEATSKVPMEDRHAIMTKASIDTDGVKKALASHRHFWSRGKELNKDGTLNPKCVAKSFIHYQAALSKDTLAEDENSDSTSYKPSP